MDVNDKHYLSTRVHNLENAHAGAWSSYMQHRDLILEARRLLGEALGQTDAPLPPLIDGIKRLAAQKRDATAREAFEYAARAWKQAHHGHDTHGVAAFLLTLGIKP